MFLCDKPSVIDGSVYLAFQKTRDGAGETPGSEVFFLRSSNLLTVDDLDDAIDTVHEHGGQVIARLGSSGRASATAASAARFMAVTRASTRFSRPGILSSLAASLMPLYSKSSEVTLVPRRASPSARSLAASSMSLPPKSTHWPARA